MSATMTRRERVLAALRGDPVDRVPLSFWLHNFVAENSAKGLADETMRLVRTFDWDYLKPQSRAQGFAEMWGLTYRPSTDRAREFAVTHTPIIWTVFAPMMVMAYLLRGGREQALALCRTEPKAMEAGLAAVTETLTVYAAACLEAGGPRAFFSTQRPRAGG